MNKFIRSVQSDSASYEEPKALSLLRTIVFAVLCSVCLLLYSFLIFTSTTWPVVFAGATFLFFVLTVALWSRCPKVKPALRKDFVFSMPVHSFVRPRLAYRVSRFFVILGIIFFCAGNCVLSVFELREPLLTLFFCAAAAIALTTYGTVLKRER